MNSLLPVLFQPKPDTIYNFDALQLLRLLPDESVNCCVTSPPYFGLRDYGADGQIGLEPTPEEYVTALVTVFRELRRVLRSDGAFWLNIGDSFASGELGRHDSIQGREIDGRRITSKGTTRRQAKLSTGIAPKNLIGVPWRVALALQDDGWVLRSDTIWAKPNPMPESVRDRPTRSHEYVFLFTKSPRYWYDAEAVAEPATEYAAFKRGSNKHLAADTKYIRYSQGETGLTPTRMASSSTRNRRSVWTINPEPLSAAHFAVMPSKLVEICVLAACPPKVCSACGAPYQRVVDGERTLDTSRPQARRALELFEEKGLTDDHLKAMRAVGLADAGKALMTMNGAGKNTPEQQRLADEAKAALGGYYREFLFGKRSSNGWKPACDCHAPHDSGIVIDPFMGAGTVALVAQRLNRHFIGSDLNPEYVRMATMRVQGRLDEYLAEQRGEPHTAYMFAEEGGVA